MEPTNTPPPLPNPVNPSEPVTPNPNPAPEMAPFPPTPPINPVPVAAPAPPSYPAQPFQPANGFPPAVPSAAPAQATYAPATPQITPTGNGMLQRPSANPFAHMFRGLKNLFTTNLLPTLLFMLIIFALSIAVTLVLAASLVNTTNVFSQSGGLDVSKIIITVVSVVVAYYLVGSYLFQVFNRIVLTGSRKQAIKLGEAFRFAGTRYGLTLLTFLTIILGLFGLTFLAGFGIGFLTRGAPIVSALLPIIIFVVSIILVLRLSYVALAIVDDEKPAGVMAAIHKSTSMWKKGRLALILFWLSVILLTIVLTLISGRHTISTMGTDNGGLTTNTSSATGFVYGLISIVIDLLAFAGLANIYNETEGRTESSEAPFFTPQAPTGIPTSATPPSIPPTPTA